MTTSNAPWMTRPAFLILLSLADRARHGLGIVEDVEERTAGAVKLGPGTLYGTLKRLAEEKLVMETRDAPDPGDHDPRRRYYELTAAGRDAVRREAEDLRLLVDVAVGKRVLGSEA